MKRPSPITRLVENLSRLPGIGEKTAMRLAFHILQMTKQAAKELADAITRVKEEVILCGECYNLTEKSPCDICRDPERSPAQICVVEEPVDLLAIERSGGFHGRYHVLHGALSPLDGIGSERLRIAELLERLRRGKTEEVILATNPNAEGDATSLFLSRELKPTGVRVTRLARGLPVGGDLEYADQVTIGKSLENRREITEPDA
ncbi:MAG: recombination mediator RecR [Vicinamibacteria bacterium]